MKQLLAGIVLALFLAVPTWAATTKSGSSVSVTESIADDLYLSGSSVAVSVPVSGELWAVGQTVSIAERSARSLYVAGETVAVKQGAGYNLFAAGKTVTLAGEYGHDVFVAGGTVVIERDAKIHGSLYAAGETVTVHGSVDGNVVASASTLQSDATVHGSLTAHSTNLAFTGGSVGGDLRYEGTAAGLEQVTVSGETKQLTEEASLSDAARDHQFSPVDALGRAASLFAVGVVAVWLMPKRLEALVADLKGRWLARFGIGAITLMLTPVAALILALTVIGAPLAVVTMLLYSVALLVASFLTATVLGQLAVPQQSVWIRLGAGALLVGILSTIPAVGGWVQFILFVALTVPLFGSFVNGARSGVKAKQ